MVLISVGFRLNEVLAMTLDEFDAYAEAANRLQKRKMRNETLTTMVGAQGTQESFNKFMSSLE